MDIKQIIIQSISEVLNEVGQSYVLQLQERLQRQGLGDSKLIDSISFDVNGNVLTINMAEYADFVDKGRSPGKFPPPNEIEDWVKRKGLTMTDGPSNLEQNQKSLSYLIGRKIANEGIEPREFIDPTPEEIIQKEIKERIETRITEEILK